MCIAPREGPALGKGSGAGAATLSVSLQRSGVDGHREHVQVVELFVPHLLRHVAQDARSDVPDDLVVLVQRAEPGLQVGVVGTADELDLQDVVDRPHRDLRRARSAINALVPTTTGSATAIGLIYPELAGRLNGHAVRVPLLNASLTDCVFELARDTDVEEINTLFARWAAGPLEGILGYEARPLVSTDFLDDPRSAVVDGPATMVVDGTQAKVYVWYDSEWGYSCRLADVVGLVSDSLE